MAHAENEVVINRPVADVFNFLVDGLNNPKWRPGVVSIKLASGVAGHVDAQYKQVLKGPSGKSIDGDYRITTADPNKVLRFIVITGPARPVGNFYLDSMASATKVRFVLDFQPKGIAKLMGPMIQKTMQSEVGQLAALKQILESA